MIICSQECPCCPSLSLDSPSPTWCDHLMIYLPFQNSEHPATGCHSRQAFRILMKIQASHLRCPQFPAKVRPSHSRQMAGLWEYGSRSQWAVSWEQTVAPKGPSSPPGQDHGLCSPGSLKILSQNMAYQLLGKLIPPPTPEDRQVETPQIICL